MGSQELAEYKSESNQLKNQDLTIRKLEERTRHLDAQLEEKVGMDLINALLRPYCRFTAESRLGDVQMCHLDAWLENKGAQP